LHLSGCGPPPERLEASGDARRRISARLDLTRMRVMGLIAARAAVRPADIARELQQMHNIRLHDCLSQSVFPASGRPLSPLQTSWRL
jgi:hypothetical protein